LAGTVNSKNAAEKAVAIAQSVKGVISVENHVKIVAEK
jgi:osmotically-inducible protein OsmY